MGRIRILSILWIGVLAVAVGLPAAARGEDDPEALIREGNALRMRGQTARALGLYKRAYDIGRTPRTAAQLGLCEFALKSYLDAMTHFSEALASHERWIEENRTELERVAGELKKHLAEIAVSGAPAGAAVVLDGKVVGTLPAATAWSLPGRASLVVKAPGFVESSRVLEVSGGERRYEKFQLEPQPPPAGAAPARDREVALAPPPAAPARSSQNLPVLVASPSPPSRSATETGATPIYGTWWFWTAVGAVVLAGAAVLVATHPWRSDSPCDVSPCKVW